MVLHGLDVVWGSVFDVVGSVLACLLYVDRGPGLSLFRHFDIHGLHILTVPKLMFSLKHSFTIYSGMVHLSSRCNDVTPRLVFSIGD